jgi:hypothetical protein
MPNYVGGGDRPAENPDVRGDLLAFSVARQAALGQEEIFRAVKALRDENDKLVERCKALGREVSLTQAENKQLAGHISRVLGLVTSFTQAQASSNNEVRSVLTAQVLALTEHVSALTKQFTIFQLDQRQSSAEDRSLGAAGGRRGSLVPAASGDAAALRRQLCDSYIALCGSVHATPSGSVLSALTTGAANLTLVVSDLRDLWALTETLKSSVDVPDAETRRQWEKEAAEAAEAAAAPVLSRAPPPPPPPPPPAPPAPPLHPPPSAAPPHSLPLPSLTSNLRAARAYVCGWTITPCCGPSRVDQA